MFDRDHSFTFYDTDIEEGDCENGTATGCAECGDTVAFIDDCTYTVSRDTPVQLSEKLSAQYKLISSYMSSNRLVINDEKTHVLVFSKKSRISEREEVKLKAGLHEITPLKTEKLLGGHISQELKWNEHILDNEHSLIRQLNSRINGLIKVCKSAPFKQRLMIANGIFISRCIYLIQVWGGASKYLIKSIQILMNKAARAVTRLSWYTPTRILMKQCNWLSVSQLIHYHTVLLTHKVVMTQRPKYLHDKMCTSNTYNTRAKIKFGENFTGRTALASGSFCYRSATTYNLLPQSLREIQSIPTFKRRPREWTMRSIGIE